MTMSRSHPRSDRAPTETRNVWSTRAKQKQGVTPCNPQAQNCRPYSGQSEAAMVNPSTTPKRSVQGVAVVEKPGSSPE